MRHFDELLDELRKRLVEMSGLVESAIHQSVRSLVERNEELARQVLRGESRINQMEIEIDDLATALLALDQPVASDLRFITAAIKINTNLERMGDKAANIAERSIALLAEPRIEALVDMPHLANLVQAMVKKALDAFVNKDSELARSVLMSDDAVDELRDAMFSELIEHMQRDPTTVRQCVDLIFVARSLERIADHCTNIAEEVLFAVEGIDVRHHAAQPID
jgi:phosphate transport system protein